MTDYENLAVRMGAAIVTLAEKEDNRINFELYVSQHGEKWFSHFCKDFESLVDELELFAYMKEGC